ncbi:N-acetyltransferase 9 isoform X1 [Orussus abietinus]|uniref:N-acetyltransferase 9 isoform X1 n=1 Tax=Orussus abietinus TaxID=222816 RepID=UPI000625E70C|nr:N-acetyltransferase 9 isoform X1 [Orussus abietinus]
MKINKSTRITGKNVVLVPYKEKHVLRYHEWMKSPELQRLTASEPLTLEQEYSMQRSWHEDADKCTFIILDKHQLEETRNEIEAMIGDTNLYLNDPEEPSTAEVEIMIAVTKNRGKGHGWESVIHMLRYGIEMLNVKKFRAKISLDNVKSIKLFTKLQFAEVQRCKVFQEITMEKKVEEDWIHWLMAETKGTSISDDYE